jgi:hypothetical protein
MEAKVSLLTGCPRDCGRLSPPQPRTSRKNTRLVTVSPAAVCNFVGTLACAWLREDLRGGTFQATGPHESVQDSELVSKAASNSFLGVENGFVTVTPFHVKPSCRSSDRRSRQPASAVAERTTESQIPR